MGSLFLAHIMIQLRSSTGRSAIMNNLIKIIFAGAAAIVAGKTVSNAAKEHAEETMRTKEALLKFATREQRPEK